MAVKEENEITVKVIGTKDELVRCLTNAGFKAGRIFSLDDYYFIPNSLDIKRMSTREIIAKAVIIRYIVNDGKISQKVTFKIKDIAENGDIISQRAINCDVYNIDEAKKLFEALGYYEIMNIKENDIIYSKNGFELAIKFVENSDILIEIETEPNTEWDTIEKIKNILSQINIPIEKDKYFIKKAEDELNKILKRYEINSELKKHIEQIIDYHYKLNDKGHGVEHAKYVINRSFEFAYQVESINLEMVYVIAAYHDVAHHIDAKNHENISAKMLREDKKLNDFFTDEQIKIMSEAVEDHRSSMETEPRSIYGKIVSSADRNTSVEVTLKRCYSYNRRHFSELKESEIIEECRKFLLKKFGINGYARSKMFFDDKEYKKYLDDITDLALDSDKFAVEIKKVNEIY